MRGLTGTPDQVEQIAKVYRVYRAKNAEPDQEEDYLLDHSIVMYLMGPDGKFVKFFGADKNEEDITQAIVSHLREQGVIRK
jgi:protein SCO1/2